MKRLKFLLVFIFATALLLVWNSCCTIFDDLADCPYTLHVRFYNSTPCDKGVHHAERVRHLKKAHIAFFDAQNKLVKHYHIAALSLNAEKSELYTDIVNPPVGDFKMMCWLTDKNDVYTDTDIREGMDASQIIKTLAKQPVSDLFHGSEKLKIADHAGQGAVTDTLDMNVLSFVYNLNISVRGVDSNKKYFVNIVSNNAAYNFLGESVGKMAVYKKPLNVGFNSPESVGTALTMLKIAGPKGIKSTLQILEDGTQPKEVFAKDLAGLITEAAAANGAKPNFDCEHLYNIDILLKLKPDGTYMAVSAVVNDWNVVFRDVDLGN